MRNPASFLHWVRRMLEVRKQHPVFGTGTFEVLDAENPSVLAYLRRQHGRRAERHRAVRQQPRRASPSRSSSIWRSWRARSPVELLGRVPFPPIGELPYFVTLPPYGFYWFTLHDEG